MNDIAQEKVNVLSLFPKIILENIAIYETPGFWLKRPASKGERLCLNDTVIDGTLN
jgi:hypothetical protein